MTHAIAPLYPYYTRGNGGSQTLGTLPKVPPRRADQDSRPAWNPQHAPRLSLQQPLTVVARLRALAEGRGERPPVSALRQPGKWVALPRSCQVIYLRRFKDLRTLRLSGNPIAELDDYRMFICAHLPGLVYLDFQRIDDHMASVSLGLSQLCESVFSPAPPRHPAPSGFLDEEVGETK